MGHFHFKNLQGRKIGITDDSKSALASNRVVYVSGFINIGHFVRKRHKRDHDASSAIRDSEGDVKIC